MKLLFIVVTSFFLVLPAFSKAYGAYRLETSCNFGDCAHSGWESSIWGSSLTANTECKAGDCFQNGWITSDSAGNIIEVTCKSGGCWTGGWDDVQWVQNRTTYDTMSCNNGSCLTDGWSGQSSTGATQTVVCNNHDCAHQGWDSWGQGHSSFTGCKLSNCFENGWTVDVY